MTAPSSGWIDALDTAELVRSKQATAAEVLEATISRVEKVNPALNFIAHEGYELGRAIAAAPQPEGVFHGVPYLIKDLGAQFPGMPSTSGAMAFKDLAPEQPDTVSERAVAAGFVPFATSTTSEFGWAYNSTTQLHGTTRGPWDVTRSAGGSSGGAAAAVGARAVPIAHAGDGGGSIRVPAAWNGIVGLKTSRGRVPVGPSYAESVYGFGTEGCVSVTVRDTAAYLDAVSGGIPGDAYTPATPEGGFLASLARPRTKLRIGLVTSAPTGQQVWDESRIATEKAGRLSEELGHDVEPASLDFDVDRMYHHLKRISAVMIGEGVLEMESYWGREAREDEFGEFARDSARYASKLSASEHAADYAAVRMFSRQIAAQMRDYDVLLMPTTPVKNHTVDQHLMYGADYEFEKHHREVIEIGNFAMPWNCSGQPAISLPLHWSEEGLPVGVQAVAAFSQEATLLNLAAQLEQVAPWRDIVPPVNAL